MARFRCFWVDFFPRTHTAYFNVRGTLASWTYLLLIAAMWVFRYVELLRRGLIAMLMHRYCNAELYLFNTNS